MSYQINPMMKRLFFLFAFLAVVSCPRLAAQDTDDTAPMWGVRAAFDVNLPGDWHVNGSNVKMYKHGYGGTVGAVCNLYLGKGFYLEPGVSLFYDSYSYDNLIIGADSDGNGIATDPSLYKFGFRVPVVAGYSFDIGRAAMSVYTGPEVSVALAGKVRVDTFDKDDFDLDLFGPNGQNRFALSWKVGIGVPLDSWFVSLDASLGVTDVYRSDVSFREHRVSVGLTKYF